MLRNWRIYLNDIEDSSSKIMDYVRGLEREAFFADSKTLDATIRNLEIIGEATKHIPQEHRSQMPLVPWHQISAMRNILAHAYFGIDEDILWDVITHHVPLLHNTTSDYLRNHPD